MGSMDGGDTRGTLPGRTIFVTGDGSGIGEGIAEGDCGRVAEVT